MKQLLHFNLVCGIVFSIFITTTFVVFETDSRWNVPMSVEQYVSRCGKTFDYYAGYCYVTSNDSRNVSSDTRTEFSLSKKTYFRYMYLFLYTILWFVGALTPTRIKYFRHWLVTKETESDETQDEEIEWDYRFEDYFFMLISTVISFYGIYYSITYLSTFWHN